MTDWMFSTCQKCGRDGSKVERVNVAGVHAQLCCDCFSDLSRALEGCPVCEEFLLAENELQRLMYMAASNSPPYRLREFIMAAVRDKLKAYIARFDVARKLIPRAGKVLPPEEKP